jgi:hypothetical protein
MWELAPLSSLACVVALPDIEDRAGFTCTGER